MWAEVERNAISHRRDQLIQQREERDRQYGLPTGTAWQNISAYNRACHELWPLVPPAARQRYADLADEWSYDGPPDNVVARRTGRPLGYDPLYGKRPGPVHPAWGARPRQ